LLWLPAEPSCFVSTSFCDSGTRSWPESKITLVFQDVSIQAWQRK
jgi:hypothetical protein